MTKTMSSMALIAGLLFTGASAAHAQTLTPQPETGAFVSLSVGGQPQKRSFGSSGTFTSFGETGRFEINQNVGAGFMFDVAGAYQFWKRLSAGVSIWHVSSQAAVSAAASIPDPVFFGRFTTVNADSDEDLSQGTLGVNIQVMYSLPLSDRLGFTVSLGPSIIRTKLEVGKMTVVPNSQTIVLSTDSQSKTTAKAGNLGVDFTYRLKELYAVGLFVRYAGGEVDLPAKENLKVGGLQVGGVIRYRF